MYLMSNLSEIETLCNKIMNSPYFRKETPDELVQLRAMLENVSLLVKVNMPPLVSEVKQLRSKNKKLNAQIEALDSRPLQTNTPGESESYASGAGGFSVK